MQNLVSQYNGTLYAATQNINGDKSPRVTLVIATGKGGWGVGLGSGDCGMGLWNGAVDCGILLSTQPKLQDDAQLPLTLPLQLATAIVMIKLD